jgi:hypothetical protein
MIRRRFDKPWCGSAVFAEALLVAHGSISTRHARQANFTGLAVTGTVPPTGKAAVNRIVNAALDSNDPRRPSQSLGDPNAQDRQREKAHRVNR